MEINEIHPDEKSKGYLFSLAIAKESALLACILAETKRQSEQWESFIVAKREGFGCALIGSCWCGEAEASQLQVGRPMRVNRGTYLALSSWP